MNSGSTEFYTLSKEGEFLTTEISGHKYAFKKWNWGEKNALSIACTTVNPMNGFISFDDARFDIGLVEKTVYKFDDGKATPFTSTEINGLDAQLGERLFRITQKFNLVQVVETTNL